MVTTCPGVCAVSASWPFSARSWIGASLSGAGTTAMRQAGPARNNDSAMPWGQWQPDQRACREDLRRGVAEHRIVAQRAEIDRAALIEHHDRGVAAAECRRANRRIERQCERGGLAGRARGAGRQRWGGGDVGTGGAATEAGLAAPAPVAGAASAGGSVGLRRGAAGWGYRVTACGRRHGR